MCTSVFVVSFLLIGGAIGIDEDQAKIRFYHDSMDNYTELYFDEADEIFSTNWYAPDRRTAMFTHGFTGHPGGPAIKAVVTTLLELGEYNVALLNWEKLAAQIFPSLVHSYMNYAAPNAIQVGKNFSEALLKLANAGLDLNNTQFIGHSLGAHIFGITGYKMREKGIQLPWIVGLDPALGFDMKPASLRLGHMSARFVSVIHSDPSKFGSNVQLGMVDFWPNYKRGTVIQPGCPKNPVRFSDEDFCSHNMSWKFLIDAILNPGTILGSHAKNFMTWKRYSMEQRKENVLDLGALDYNAKPGNYYFITSEAPPYGLGEYGL